ncbi:Protein adenylyltransferase VbhT [Oligella ureolytica]
MQEHNKFSQKYTSDLDQYVDQASGVLINLPNITDAVELARVEAAAVVLRTQELITHPVAKTFDLAHLQAIHAKQFQDIYTWAGEIRTVDISKGDTRFAHFKRIIPESKKLTDALKKENFLINLNEQEFSSRAAYYMGELNVIHPFREGNGRSLRQFVSELAGQAGYCILWENITQQEMIQASIDAYHGSHELLTTLIQNNLRLFDNC